MQTVLTQVRSESTMFSKLRACVNGFKAYGIVLVAMSMEISFRLHLCIIPRLRN